MRDQLARFHAAITGAAPLDTAADLIVRGHIDELERLRAYAYAYPARIAAALAHDYPKLATLIDLRELTPDYLRAYPSTHPSLREIGAPLAAFLTTRGTAPQLADLARIERARLEVFDGEDTTPLVRSDVAELDPAAFPELRLRFVPSSLVVAITTNADELWTALEAGRDIPKPASTTRTVLVWRREYTVIHRTLDADEARAAHALANGVAFGDVCALLDAPADRAFALLVRWLDAQCLRRD